MLKKWKFLDRMSIKSYGLLVLAATVITFLIGSTGWKSRPNQIVVLREDSEGNIKNPPNKRYPDTTFRSTEALKWIVERKDTTDDGLLTYLEDPYDALIGDVCENTTHGTFTFRGNQQRNQPVSGQIYSVPSEIVKVWEFETDQDTTRTPYGIWYGGAGWAGQPVFVHWSDSALIHFKACSPALTSDFAENEVIIGSLCGDVFFE